jgi:hypothetical protein
VEGDRWTGGGWGAAFIAQLPPWPLCRQERGLMSAEEDGALPLTPWPSRPLALES